MSPSLSIPRGGLSARDRRALAFLIPAAALILALNYVVLPLWDQATEASRALESRQKTLRKYRAAARAVPEHESSATSLAAALENSEKGLLSGATPALQGAEVQQMVRDLANAAGIQLRSVGFTTPKNFSDDYALVGVSTQFAAPIEQVMALLNALQSSPRILGLDQIRISAANVPPSGKDVGKKQVLVTIVVSGVAKALPPTSAGESGK
jgi:type II secretory pathway component PulM